jgi:hypothetical protein
MVLVLFPVDVCVWLAGRAGFANLLQRWLRFWMTSNSTTRQLNDLDAYGVG